MRNGITIRHTRLINTIAQLLSPAHLTRETRARRILSGLVVLFTAPVLFTFGSIHILSANRLLGIFLLTSAGFLVLSFLTLRRVENGVNVYRLNLAWIGAVFFYLLVISAPDGDMALWLFVYPLASVFLLGKREGSIFAIVLLTLAVIWFGITHLLPQLAEYRFGFCLRFVLAYGLVCGLTYSSELIKQQYHSDLRKERAKLIEQSGHLQQTVETLEETKSVLRESESKYRALVERANDGIVLVQEGRIVYANPRIAEIMGEDTDHVIDQSFIGYVHPDEREKLAKRYRQRLAGTPVPARYDSKLVVRDNRTIDIEVNAGLIPFQGGLADLVFIRDISDRKRAERELRAAWKMAQKASMAKSNFLANMSHELRTPLNHIIGFTEIVLDQHFGKLNSQQKEYLSDVLNSSRHLLSLINDVLDLAKVEAGKMQLRPEMFALAPLFEECINLFRENASKHQIEFRCRSNALPAEIRADKRAIRQVLYNLVSNAVKFSFDGGKIELRAAMLTDDNGPKNRLPAAVVEKGPLAGPWMMISVADSGIGLDPQMQEAIFKPFEQAETAASRKFQGTGLGLSLSKKIVELHGGRIWAESSGSNQGCTFYFVLPIKPL